MRDLLIMSARNYFSGPEKSLGKSNCLPKINSQNFVHRPGPELPPLSANTSKCINRNLNYFYELKPYDLESDERAGTPFSDFFYESETETPDFQSEESDSSAGSALCRSTAEATRILAQEWEKIERTLYNEDGEKCTRPHIVEECKQWQQIHPQLRIVGRGIPLSGKRLSCKQIEHDEVIAMQYNDYEQLSGSEERLSQSSNDVTPQNSPRTSLEDLNNVKLMREKVSFYPSIEDEDLTIPFCSLLQITPIQMHSPSLKKRQNHTIVRSEIASSRWMRGSRPDSSVNCERNSAKSFNSLDTRNFGNALSASERNPFGNRVLTAKHKESRRLEPLCSPELTQNGVSKFINGAQYSVRKVSLPPLFVEDKKKFTTTNSAKKYGGKTKKTAKCLFQLDRVNRS